MGKGTIGVNPFHTDRSLMSPVAVCGLLATLVAFTDTRGFILDKSHWMLYFITMSMYPVRFSLLPFPFSLPASGN
jgi:26S proteasome regulatory subunit N1